ncbi:MAG TPA: polymer-forming cytoskeletal protein [Steroidobacteraceae bacterium]|nr:polymer-forming cytoskeletal protein [Steroidobacteraceae bacterium]
MTVDTLIGAKTRIKGDVEFAGGLHLDGTIHGNVTCEPATDAFLSVSEHGRIEGSVFAPNVLLNGTVTGNIEAAQRVELGAKAKVLGNVAYTVIETAVGAQINGKLIHQAAAGPGQGPDQTPAGPDQTPAGPDQAPAGPDQTPGTTQGEPGSQS